MNGILVAMTVMVATLPSKGRLARTATYQLLRPYPNQRQRVVYRRNAPPAPPAAPGTRRRHPPTSVEPETGAGTSLRLT
jgi:hypothetical protein